MPRRLHSPADPARKGTPERSEPAPRRYQTMGHPIDPGAPPRAQRVERYTSSGRASDEMRSIHLMSPS
jgi:hypothetical protein